MKNKIIAILLCVILATGILPVSAFATQDTDSIIILYETDAHCNLTGYTKLAAMKKELLESYDHVGIVSGGDYIQGSSLGSISRGEYIVNLMNIVGYDAITLGNHEFDYRIPRLQELVGILDTKPVCCNFQKIGDESSFFEPYTIVSYGNTDIAYIGITTPQTIASSSPSQFKDEQGEYVYTFHGSDLYDVVQDSIDSALEAGADHIVAISHIGYDESGGIEDVTDMIENTSGFDVVLDGHSHNVIEGKMITDKAGNDVLLSSAGANFEYVGKLTIRDGQFSTEMIPLEGYEKTDPEVDEYLEKIESEYTELGNRKIAVSEVHLITHDKDGNRLIRNTETNLGNFCADAFRYVTGADIGCINGGGIRSDIKVGDISFNDILSVFPFNNKVVVAEVSGQIIKDMLEAAVMYWPNEDGSFYHMSGLTFSVNGSIPSPVVLDENEMFAGINGQYRVYDIKVLNGETGKYEPIHLDQNYTLAGHDHLLLNGGSGMSMFEGAKIVLNDGMLDVELLEQYIIDHLDGVIGEEYAEVKHNITFTDGEIVKESNKLMWVIIPVIIGSVLVVVAVIILVKCRKR